MKYKAVFLDVDGTTVLHGMDSIPSARVIRAIEKTERAGVRVALATSRPPKAVVRVLSAVRISGHCVLSSGAEIYDPIKRTVVRRLLFPDHAVERIAAAAGEVREKLMVYDGESEYIYDGKKTDSIVGMFFPEISHTSLLAISKHIRDVEGITLHRMEAWNPTYECLDIVNERASKKHGVEHVTKSLGIRPEDVIGIGDGHNDLPLLEACGLKIAMGNAVPELKALANVVAPSVEEDGVAWALEKFLFSA